MDWLSRSLAWPGNVFNQLSSADFTCAKDGRGSFESEIISEGVGDKYEEFDMNTLDEGYWKHEIGIDHYASELREGKGRVPAPKTFGTALTPSPRVRDIPHDLEDGGGDPYWPESVPSAPSKPKSAPQAAPANKGWQTCTQPAGITLANQAGMRRPMPTALPSDPASFEEEEANGIDGPVQLICIDDAGKCHLQEKALAILRGLRGRVAVVGVAGPYRSGKSFLLNRLLGLKKGGFEIGPSVNPCTKGLWIWGRPVQLAPDYHMIFLDTEGLGSAQRTASCDVQIFALCVLLSSYLIYNSLGAIDEQAVDEMQLILRLASHLHVKAQPEAAVQENCDTPPPELADYFPSFMWVLRDFHLQLTDADGKSITESEYLENALKPQAGQEEKNKMRETVRQLFRVRDCTTLVRPVANEEHLRRIDSYSHDVLRPQFRLQVEAFVKKVNASVRPKVIDGTPVSGAMLAQLASAYCAAINDSAVPTIQSAWTSVLQHQLRMCIKKAYESYRDRMQSIRSNFPVHSEELRSLHKAAKHEALESLLAVHLETSDPKFVESRAELSSRIRQVFNILAVENHEESQRQCESLAEDLYRDCIEPKLGDYQIQITTVTGVPSPRSTMCMENSGTSVPGPCTKGSASAAGGAPLEEGSHYQNFNHLLEDWVKLREHYTQLARGPARAEVLSSRVFAKMTASVQRLWEELHRGLDEKDQATHLKVVEAGARTKAASDILEQERFLQKGSFGAAVQQWAAERSDLEDRVAAAKREIEDASLRCGLETAAMNDTRRMLQMQVKLLEERLSAATKKSAGLEVANLKDTIYAAMADARGAGTEKAVAQLRAAQEKQLADVEQKFQKQLLELRETYEHTAENVRKACEAEAAAFRKGNSALAARAAELEKELEQAQDESQELRLQATIRASERSAEERLAKTTAEKQQELVVTFLEWGSRRREPPKAILKQKQKRFLITYTQ